ncbi:MAG: DUF2790 domain-containing protein [Pseudomonas sp.]
MKTLILSLATIAFSGTLFAAQAPTAPIIDSPAAFHTLDIAKVEYSTNLQGLCGVQMAQLRYQDHMSREHQLNYDVIGDGCPSDN